MLKTIFIFNCKKIIFNAKNAKMKINVAIKIYSKIQTLFEIKFKYEFQVIIIIIKLNIQNHFFFTTILYRFELKIKIIF